MEQMWDGGYEATWEMGRVDERTWARSTGAFELLSARIDRDATPDAPTLEAGEIELTASEAAGFDAGWYRIGFSAGGARHEVATLWAEEGSREWNAGSSVVKLRCRSVLYPASVRGCRVGDYAPMGANGASLAARLVSECTPARVTAEGAFELSDHIVHDLGASRLEAAWAVLDAADWCMRIDELGNVSVGPKPAEPALLLDTAGASALVPGTSMEAPAEVCNVYVAVDGEMMVEAVNDDPGSPSSTASVGFRRELWDTSPARVDGETLYAYAHRKLAEQRVVERVYEYTREYRPGVLPFSLVRGRLPEAGISGDLRVLAQTLDCSHGVTVSERAGYEEVV